MKGRLWIAQNRDDFFGTRDLDRLVHIVHDGHELGHRWLPQDRIVSGPKVHHIEKDHFGPKVTRRAKGDTQLSSPQWFC